MLSLSVSRHGDFTIALDGASVVLAGDEYVVAGLTSKAGTLVLKSGIEPASGTDSLGEWTGYQLHWASATDRTTTLMRATFQTYESDPGVLVFEQHFPNPLPLNVPPKQLAATAFPAFRRSPGPTDSLDCFAYHGVFPALAECTFATYFSTRQGGTPLVVYNRSEASLPMVVFSQLDWPKAQHLVGDKRYVGAGVKATASSVPAGWSQRTLLSAGAGIRDGMMAWGERVLKFRGGKPRPSLYLDATHSTIGFCAQTRSPPRPCAPPTRPPALRRAPRAGTDNGGYYHYATGSNETYEEVLPRVKAHHEALGVRFGHWQFDSWFYPKDGAVGPSGGGGGVVNWTALPSVFPSGMAAIQERLRVPMVMHNRQWSQTSDYVAHEAFGWHKGPKWAVPADPPAFFRWFFRQQEGWGLSMYEQDWMSEEYNGVAALQTNISLADDWLRGMAEGAAASGRTVQYCM